MSHKTNIFITGVTGFIGGTVLLRLLNHPDFASFNVTAFVRSADKAEKIKENFGINVAIGSHDDTQLVESLAAQSDIVIAIVDADNIPAATATLAGLKKRYEATGVVPIFIHTSGTGVLIDDALGDRTTDKIYEDTKPSEILALPDTQIHRDVELLVLKADKEGYVKSYLITPPTIYGIAKGPLVDLGIQNRFSIQIPMLIRVALARGRAGVIGSGKNIWDKVHVEDLADFYVLLFDAARKGKDLGHGEEGYYFAETGEYVVYDVAKTIGETLVSLGLSDNPQPTPFTKEEVEYMGGSHYFGPNSRSRAKKARALGWKPVKTDEDFFDDVRAEVKVLAAERT